MKNLLLAIKVTMWLGYAVIFIIIALPFFKPQVELDMRSGTVEWKIVNNSDLVVIVNGKQMDTVTDIGPVDSIYHMVVREQEVNFLYSKDRKTTVLAVPIIY
jgi:hypothetical protein